MLLKFFLLFFILIFALESRYDFIQLRLFSEDLYSEGSLVEIIQALLLLSTFLLTIKNRKLIFKISNKLFFNVRVFFIFALFYEEVSFLTSRISNSFNSSNFQNEINFHNLNFFHLNFLSFYIDYINLNFDMSFQDLFFCLILFILCFGLYVPSLKKYRILFLEKIYSPFFILYFIVIIISSVSINSFPLFNGYLLIEHEFLELIFYIIVLKDTFDKLRIIKSRKRL